MEEQIKDYINQLPEFKKLNYEIITCQKGHKDIPEIKDNKIGIYIYAYKGQYLKIGKAWSKSEARWKYQHYNCNSSKSNLAASIKNDENFCTKNKIDREDDENIKTWIKDNTTRINIVIQREKDSEIEYFYLNLLEAWLHIKCNPKYEGYETQRLSNK